MTEITEALGVAIALNAGAALSGLYAAYLLEQKGIRDYIVLEARETLGGRILSEAYPPTTAVADAVSSFDLGPSWFWPEYQPQLDALVRALQVERHEQFESGQMLVEHSADRPAMATPGYASSPASMRLVGGMGALFSALHRRVDPRRILTGHTVKSLLSEPEHIQVSSMDLKGKISTWSVEHVLLAAPPHFIASHVEFFPQLPEKLSASWTATETCMTPHAKYFAI